MMKRGAFLLCIFTVYLLCSCDDTLTKVGTTIQPPGDLITVYTDTFQMKASTVRLDSIYAKTSDCLLGEMYDPVYGIIKADIICQFYCEEGFRFKDTPYNNKVDSVELLIFYPFYGAGSLPAYGDTLTPMQVTVYPVNKPLKRNFYTNDRPELYCDMSRPLGSTTYTLYDYTVPEDLHESREYTPMIRVRLPAEFGQKFYDETLNNPSTFDDQNAFNEFFPGVYLTNTYGSGCLVRTVGENIAIRMFYSVPRIPDEESSDTLALSAQWFYVSKDVIQINRFENDKIDQLLVDNPTHTYIKAPAGVCTKLVLPTTEISKEIDIKDRFINGFSLNLKYLPEDEWAFACAPPDYLLLLPEDSVTTFFEKGSIENNVTSFVSFMNYDAYYMTSYSSSTATPYGYSPYNRTYSFGNISNMLKSHIDNSPDKDLSLLVLPVTRKATNYNNTYYTTDITHSFSLSGVKIRTEAEFMKVIVLSSKYEK